MDHPINLTIELLHLDHLDRRTEEMANDLLAMADTLEREAKEKQSQAYQLREAANILLMAHAVFDLSSP
jgi:hypothetical protein